VYRDVHTSPHECGEGGPPGLGDRCPSPSHAMDGMTRTDTKRCFKRRHRPRKSRTDPGGHGFSRDPFLIAPEGAPTSIVVVIGRNAGTWVGAASAAIRCCFFVQPPSRRGRQELYETLQPRKHLGALGVSAVTPRRPRGTHAFRAAPCRMDGHCPHSPPIAPEGASISGEAPEGRGGGRAYRSSLRNTRQALVPPKPKLLDITVRRPAPSTRSRTMGKPSAAGSRCSMWAEGAMKSDSSINRE